MSQHNWTVTLEEDLKTGEIYLPLPIELITQLEWNEGTEVEWIDNKNGTWTLKKRD